MFKVTTEKKVEAAPARIEMPEVGNTRSPGEGVTQPAVSEMAAPVAPLFDDSGPQDPKPVDMTDAKTPQMQSRWQLKGGVFLEHTGDGYRIARGPTEGVRHNIITERDDAMGILIIVARIEQDDQPGATAAVAEDQAVAELGSAVAPAVVDAAPETGGS